MAAIVPFTERYMQQFTDLIHTQDTLDHNGYISKPLTLAEVEKKRRCARCFRSLHKHNGKGRNNKKGKKKKKNHEVPNEKTEQDDASSKSEASSGGAPLGPPVTSGNTISVALQLDPTNAKTSHPPKQKTVVMACHFHDGQINRGFWSCCNGHSQFSKPCKSAEFHQPTHHNVGWLISQWQYYPTPTIDPWRLPQPRRAVALDCEFGVSITGDSELISLAVVDYFSGAVLIDKLVYPKVRMLHYNSPFSGIRHSDLERARRAKKCFWGRNDARAALYSFIGPDTIIVGHALHQDLTSMRLIHTNVVDTLILEQSIVESCRIDTVSLGVKEEEEEEVGNEDGGVPVDSAKPKYKKRKSGSLSLKALALDRLGREIQVGSHNALEDAIATRDLCHWYMLNVVGRMLPVGSIEGNPQYGDVVRDSL